MLRRSQNTGWPDEIVPEPLSQTLWSRQFLIKRGHLSIMVMAHDFNPSSEEKNLSALAFLAGKVHKTWNMNFPGNIFVTPIASFRRVFAIILTSICHFSYLRLISPLSLITYKFSLPSNKNENTMVSFNPTFVKLTMASKK